MSLKETTDKKTLALIDAIKKQKQEIAKAEKPNWKTNCSFSFSGNRGTGDSINLHVESDIRTLVRMAAFLTDAKVGYDAAAKNLGVEAPTFQWGGYPIHEWIEDIKTRIARVQIGEKRSKLETLENRLNKIISPELRAEMELEEISKSLGV